MKRYLANTKQFENMTRLSVRFVNFLKQLRNIILKYRRNFRLKINVTAFFPSNRFI